MPLYDYICKSCGEKFEEIVRSTDDKVACQKCGETGISNFILTVKEVKDWYKPAAGNLK